MIVVGAGIIGLSCAWRLAKAGMRVTIFDAREAASEASWAGAGMLAPGGEIESRSRMAELAMRSLAEYPGFVRELEKESGRDIDFQQCGAFEIATSDEEAERLDVRAELQRTMGILSEPSRFRSAPARFYPADATVDPRHVTAALRIACAALDCTLREHEPVAEVARDGSSIRIGNQRLSDSDGVLIAAGAWSSRICSALPRTKPVRGHLVSWELAPGTLPSIARHEHTYLLQRRNGTLIAGSSTEDAGFNRSIDPSIVEDIRRRAAGLLPELANIQPAAAWIGFRPALETRAGEEYAPVIGQIGDRLWAACGHYRNGILLAPETARIISERITAASGALR